MDKKRTVLFLCSGNSCRSQMAEAIVNAEFGGNWQAFSAGTKPSGYVHHKALQVLDEIGIKHEGTSKHTDEIKGIQFDVVITVCDSAAEECPTWVYGGKTIHHGFIDPAEAAGSDDELLNVFRQVRDEITEQIPLILKQALD